MVKIRPIGTKIKCRIGMAIAIADKISVIKDLRQALNKRFLTESDSICKLPVVAFLDLLII